MEYRVLAVGDVVGDSGLAHLKNVLQPLQKMKGIGFTVVNGENVAGVGLLPEQAYAIYDAGADVVTLGNHTFGKYRIAEILNNVSWILRPANYTSRSPGRGCGIYEKDGVTVRVLNLLGRCILPGNADNPFTVADSLLQVEQPSDAESESRPGPTFTLVDFHAEATSEKLAMGYFLDGRVSAVWGTHTHVPTADERVLPKGTGYITDLGKTGPIESVLGIRPSQSIEGFLGGIPGRYRTADGPCHMQGAIFTLETETGLCTGVERIEIE